MKLNLAIITFTVFVTVRAQTDPCAGQPNGFIAAAGSCSNYWSCVGGRGQLQTCDNPAFPIFSQAQQLCIEDDESCTPYCETPGESEDPQPIPGSCRKYLMCIAGLTIETDCGEGYGYDYIRGACDVEEKADCLTCPSDNKLYYLPDKKDCGGYYLCYNGQYSSVK